MATASSVSSKCIEISSDEDSENETDSSVGLNDNVIVHLFEKLLDRSLIFGVENKDLQHLRTVFQNASAHFLNGDSFISFMNDVLLQLKRDNVSDILTEVHRCLCSENIDRVIPNVLRNSATSFSPPKFRVSSTQFSTDLEDAKRKLIDFFNTRAINSSAVHEKADDLQRTNAENSLANGDCNGIGPVNQDTCESGSKNLLCAQYIVSPFKSIAPSTNAQGKDSSLLPNENDKENTSLVDDNDQQCSFTTAMSSNSHVTESSKDLENLEHDSSGIIMADSNTDCSKGNCNSGDNDIVIVSVIQHNGTLAGYHSAIGAQPSTSKSTYGAQNETDGTSTLQQKEKKRKLAIRSMKNRLHFYEMEIRRLMQSELTLDEMDREDSSYIEESKLKMKYSKLYSQLCKLKGSRQYVFGVEKYSRIKLTSSAYPEVNREAEIFLQSKKRFPDFFDVKRIVSNVNTTYKLGLKAQKEYDVAKSLFAEIGSKLQGKRKREFAKFSGSFLTDKAFSAADPALTDHELSKKLKRNDKISKSNTNEIFDYYEKLEYKGRENDPVTDDNEDNDGSTIEQHNRIIPMKVEDCHEEVMDVVSSECCDTEPSTGENQIASFTAVVCETSILNSTVQGILEQPNGEAELPEVGKPDQNKNYVRGSDNHSPTDNINMNPPNERYLNGHCEELERRAAAKDVLHVMKTELTDAVHGKDGSGACLDDRDRQTNRLPRNIDSHEIIVIDSDDEG